MTRPVRRARDGVGRRRWRRRRPASVAAAVAGMGVVASCGGGHHQLSAPPPTTATTVTVPASTAFVAPVVHHRRRHHHVTAPIVAPLTGLPATAAIAGRPAVVVKIDNVADAQPQTGPGQADVVYEEMVEGGLTRLAAVFQSDYPTVVGPVRSGRLTDEGIADDLGHPVLAYAGANAIFQPQLAAQPVQDVDDDTNPNLFVRNYDRPAPHNLYTDTNALAGTDATRTPPTPLWALRRAGRPMAGSGVAPASVVSIGFPSASAQWNWDAATHVWLRTQNGTADLDSTGAQLSAANVIVEAVPYVTSAYVSGEGYGADGAPIPEGIFTGSGPAWYLSGGAVVTGTWSRASLTSPTSFVDRNGHPVRLAPGRTWVELPPAGTSPAVAP